MCAGFSHGHPRRSAVASLKRRLAGGVAAHLGGRSSTAISRGLIEANQHREARPMGIRHPRRSAVASLKPEQQPRPEHLEAASSTAISRGLIEASGQGQLPEPARCHPRRSAVASLKRAGCAGLRPEQLRGHPRRSAVASLKLRRQPAHGRRERGVIHGDQPWPH